MSSDTARRARVPHGVRVAPTGLAARDDGSDLETAGSGPAPTPRAAGALHHQAEASETPASGGEKQALIAAAPIEGLLATLRQHRQTLADLLPGADAVHLLGTVISGFEHALREARRTDLWLTTDEVAQLTRKSRSAVIHRCNHGGYATARKVGSMWRIHASEALA